MATAPRICLDANGVISGIVTQTGVSAPVIDAIRDARVRLVMTPEIGKEYSSGPFKSSVRRMMRRADMTVQNYLDAVADLRRLAEFVIPAGEAPPCRDEKDRKYLHCAVFARVDYLVTWDTDLLDIGEIEGRPIITPSAFLRLLDASA